MFYSVTLTAACTTRFLRRSSPLADYCMYNTSKWWLLGCAFSATGDLTCWHTYYCHVLITSSPFRYFLVYATLIVRIHTHTDSHLAALLLTKKLPYVFHCGVFILSNALLQHWNDRPSHLAWFFLVEQNTAVMSCGCHEESLYEMWLLHTQKWHVHFCCFSILENAVFATWPV